MRPRKRIVLIDENPDRRGELAYALWINGYAVQQVSSPEEANPEAELVVAYWPGGDDYNLLAWACNCKLLLVGDISRPELLKRICVMTARKRGPKKGFKELFPGLAAEAVERKAQRSVGPAFVNKSDSADAA